MKSLEVSDDQNLAKLLKEISANVPNGIAEKTNNIIKQAKKAANKGKTSIEVKVSYKDYSCVYWNNTPSPLVEKLLSLGFTLYADKKFNHLPFCDDWDYYLEINW